MCANGQPFNVNVSLNHLHSCDLTPMSFFCLSLIYLFVYLTPTFATGNRYVIYNIFPHSGLIYILISVSLSHQILVNPLIINHCSKAQWSFSFFTWWIHLKKDIQLFLLSNLPGQRGAIRGCGIIAHHICCSAASVPVCFSLASRPEGFLLIHLAGPDLLPALCRGSSGAQLAGLCVLLKVP